MLAILVRTDEVKVAMSYPGGKSRCFHHLINLIPPHRVYIETHLGGGAVLRNKAPADVNIGIDRDPLVIHRFLGKWGSDYQFIEGSAEEYLESRRFDGSEFIYLDPPYWPQSRRSPRSPYRFDYSEEDHFRLLRIISVLPCPVMISGYSNHAYDTALVGWYRHSFPGTSRTGKRTEVVWLNYEPSILHDIRFVGRDYRERQSIKRRRARWVSKFSKESCAVQQALLTDLTLAFELKKEMVR